MAHRAGLSKSSFYPSSISLKSPERGIFCPPFYSYVYPNIDGVYSENMRPSLGQARPAMCAAMQTEGSPSRETLRRVMGNPGTPETFPVGVAMKSLRKCYNSPGTRKTVRKFI